MYRENWEQQKIRKFRENKVSLRKMRNLGKIDNIWKIDIIGIIGKIRNIGNKKKI